ncbi:MAG: protein kinase [Planctomycetes bacterium]|nr:protein kinase [Planctomycetota bacterium]
MDLPKIRNHTVIEELGQGRTGPVFKGIQESLQREVAIKIMSAKLLAHAVVVKEFLEKARSAASLSHPNIISIYNVDQEGEDLIYYTMEYLSGGSLEERIRKGVLPPMEATKLTMVIAKALEFGQKKSALHGNLKPSKVLFMEEGSSFFKLSGFGLLLGVVAKHSARHPTPFTSPEVIETERPGDFRADIYALGAIYYQMLTGSDCFEPERGLWKLTDHDIRVTPPSHVVEGVPEEMDEVLARMTAFDPDGRYGAYGEMYEPLGSLLDRLSGRGDAKKGPKGPARPPSRGGRSAEKEEAERSATPSKGVKAVAAPPSRLRPAEDVVEAVRKKKEDDAAEVEKTEAAVPAEVVRPRAAAAPSPRPAKWPVFQIVLTLVSLSALAGAMLIAYPQLSGRKEPSGPKPPTTTTAEPRGTGSTGTPPPSGSKASSKASGTTATAAPEASKGSPGGITEVRRADLELKPLENAVQRVSELVRLCTEESAGASPNQPLRVPQHVRRYIVLARGECALSLDEGKYLEALSALASLHDHHAETDRQKEYARGLIRDAVVVIDQRFDGETQAIQKQVEANQLNEAKEALEELAERYKVARWQEKARERITRINQLLEKRTGDAGSKKDLQAVLDYKKVLDQTRTRVQELAREYRFNLAAQAYDRVIASAPNEKLKQQTEYLRQELVLQAELFQRAAEVVKTKGGELKLSLSFAGISGVLSGMDEEGLILKTGEVEAKVRFAQTKPEQLSKTLLRLPLGAEGFLCLAAYCYANDLSRDGDKALEKALSQANPEEKNRINAYQDARQQFLDSGSIDSGVQEQVSHAEAKDIYLAAIYEMALGQEDSARAKLQSVVDKYPDSSAAAEARKMLEGEWKKKVQSEVEIASKEEETAKAMNEPVGEEAGSEAAGESGPRAEDLDDAEQAYQLGMDHYKKSLPGMPDRARFNELALQYFNRALKLYLEARDKDPKNDKLNDRITQINMLRYGCMKSKTLK